MIKEQPTRDELMMVVRDQENVIEATVDAQAMLHDHLIAVREQRDRAMDTIAALFHATRSHAKWNKTLLIDRDVFFEQVDEWLEIVNAREGDAQ